MAGKSGPPAPISRPLSRAYLREFSGWSTAYPPGISEPSSLRTMENLTITMDGGARVRPALRSIFEPDEFLRTTHGVTAVGGFEPFFLNNGDKAMLFAVREDDQVGFRVAVYDAASTNYTVFPADDPSYGFDMPQGPDTVAFTTSTTFVRYVQIDNKIFALSNGNEPMRVFWVGTDKVARRIQTVTEPGYNSGDRLTVVEPTQAWADGSQSTQPSAETPSTSTLISSNSGDNDYNFAYWYTFNNEIGESAPSQIRIVRTQRRWTSWNANAADDSKSTDQLVAKMPEAVWNNAIAKGAISWNLYMMTWSNQDNVPVEGLLLKTTTMQGGVGWESHGWASHTPLLEGLDRTMPLPSAATRVNYTEPSRAANGLVAGDRLILVNDRSDAAVIRWSSNQQGNYTNFSASAGGGYKTLTSGNLYVPAVAKLWQNPQSTDTITVLCMGVDGYSTSYYMQPASVSGGSQALQIMGFEETTATPGTVSPYGCEVLNNALYHPLDMQLMKSTASNYNISHRSMTDTIQDQWAYLLDKEDIVSAKLDNKIYYLVHNKNGESLESGCMGNEIWVLDTENDGTWSRWNVQGISMHTLRIRGRLHLALVQPNGIFIFDEREMLDEYGDDNGYTQERPIPWKLETNTQGANRAHDAWAHLRQVSLTVGDFHGTIKYGVRGWDQHGKLVDVSKVYRRLDDFDPSEHHIQSDFEDHLRVARELKEWVFYAESVDGQHTYGQISAVQYRYTPASVNIGYEYGSVETFEYGRDTLNYGSRNTDAGIPQPMMDTRRE